MQLGQQVWCPKLRCPGEVVGWPPTRVPPVFWPVRFGATTLHLPEGELQPWHPLRPRQDHLWRRLATLCEEALLLVEDLAAAVAERDPGRLHGQAAAFDRLVECQHRLRETYVVQQDLEREPPSAAEPVTKGAPWPATR